MNDLEFKERAYADPYDETPEFLAATQESSERLTFLAELKQFDTDMSKTFKSIQAPDNLKQKLLAPESLVEQIAPEPTFIISEAANESQFWKRALPIAACLVIVMGFAITFLPQKLSQIDQAFQQEVFAHIYEQIEFLDADDNLPITQVNQMMANSIGSQFQQTVDTSTFKIKKVNDCLIANEDAIHIVMQGAQGAVTVMLIPNSPVENEFNISDDRFTGIITPTEMGNLVVVGEQQEPILEFSNLLASNLNW